MTEHQSALQSLQAADFVLQEAGLYLNGHPDDQQGLTYFREAAENAITMRKSYEQLYGPLTLSAAGGEVIFDWNRNPLPWEWEAN